MTTRSSGHHLICSVIVLLIVLVALGSAFPLIWMVLSSFKTPAESMQIPPVWWPSSPDLSAYREVAEVMNAGRSMWNSAVIATLTTAGILITSLLAGYAFAKYQFRARDMLFSLLIATMFLPPIVTLIPLYRLVSEIGLNGTLAGVVVPNLATAFGIFLMRQFIRGVPDDLIDAARVDGASELRIVFTVVAPAVAPAVASLALFAFNLSLEHLSLATHGPAGKCGQLSGCLEPRTAAELQPGRHEHRAGHGRCDHGSAPSPGSVCVAATILRGIHRQFGGQGMSAHMAVDLGGTNLRVAVSDAPFAVAAPPQTILRQASPKTLQGLRAALAPVIESRTVTRLGIGIPGLVLGSRCAWVPNLPWLDGVDLAGLFPGVEIACANDAQLALLAEAHSGAARGIETVILLAIGTGIGSALMVDGRLARGHGGAAASFGWACGAVDGHGGDGSGWLEMQASGRALDRAAARTGLGNGAALQKAARTGDPAAGAVFETAGHALGTTLSGAIALTGAQAIVISGALAPALDLMMPSLRKRLDRNLPPHLQNVTIRAGVFGADAGLLGAAIASHKGGLWETMT